MSISTEEVNANLTAIQNATSSNQVGSEGHILYQVVSVTDIAKQRSADKYNYSPKSNFYSSVRRPLRGVTIKNETYAVLYVEAAGFKNSSRAKGKDPSQHKWTSNLLIQNISEQRTEKHQPVPTFGKDFVFFFGEQPRTINVNAILLNTGNFKWEEEWWYNYEHVLRGTRLVSKGTILKLYVEDSIFEGYLVNCSTSKDSQNPNVVSLQFTMHVSNVFSTRPTVVGSDIPNEGNEDPYLGGYVDLNPADGVGLETVVIGEDSLAMRKYNLEMATKDNQPGAVTRFLGTVYDSTLGLAEDVVELIADFTFGNRTVMPVDAAYAEFSVGNPQFAEGTDLFEKLKKGDTIDIIERPRANPGTPLGRQSYVLNYDEYPYAFSKFDDEKLKADLSKTYVKLNSTQSSKLVEKTAEKLAEAYGVPKERFLGVTEDSTGVTTISNLQGVSRTVFGLSTEAFDDIGRYLVFPTFQYFVASQSHAFRAGTLNPNDPNASVLTFPNEAFSYGATSTATQGFVDDNTHQSYIDSVASAQEEEDFIQSLLTQSTPRRNLVPTGVSLDYNLPLE